MNPSRSSQRRGGRSSQRGRSIDYGNEAPTYHQLSSHPQHQHPTQYENSNPHPPRYSNPHPTHYSNPHPTYYSNPHPTHYEYPHPTQYETPHPTQYENPHPTQYENHGIEPFTLYDTQTRSPRTPEHNPIPIEDADEAEVEGEDVTKGRPYTMDEERCLARAFVRGTDNAEHGRDQKSAKYWKDIEILYNQEGSKSRFIWRDWKSLKNKMVRIKYEVVRYFEAVAFIESAPHSGWNEVLKMEKIGEKFQSLNKNYKYAPFKFHHLVDTLRKCSKFNYITTGSGQRFEETNSSPVENETPRLSVNASNESVGEYHSGDKRSRCSVDEVNSPPHPERPIGNKAAKRAAKGKAKMGEHSSEAANREAMRLNRTLFLQEDLDHKRQAHSEKMKVMERAVFLEEKKTNMEETKMEREHDMQIMTMDVSYMAPEQQARIYQMRDDILAKWENRKSGGN